jgi:hypothetical protein
MSEKRIVAGPNHENARGIIRGLLTAVVVFIVFSPDFALLV